MEKNKKSKSENKEIKPPRKCINIDLNLDFSVLKYTLGPTGNAFFLIGYCC
jgi:hypothetical protein